MKIAVRVMRMAVAIVVLVFILTACSSSTQRSASYNFKQGIAGLQVNAIPNAPPDQLYPHSSFKMVFEVDNQAAYDITDGTLKIVGLDDKYFKLTPLDQSFAFMSGKSLTTPSGDKQFIEFDGLAADLFQNAQEYTNTYFIIANYQSTFDFVDTICINPNLYAVYDAGCKVQDRKTYSGQGAPIIVQELQEILYPGSAAGVEFRLLVKNAGGSYTKAGFVNVVNAYVGAQEISCEFQGAGANQKTVEFGDTQQQAILVCKTPLRAGSSYQTSLSVQFSYDYELRQQQQLRLINPQRRTQMFG